MKRPPMACRKNEPLSRHLSMRTGGPVKWFFEPQNADELSLLLRFLHAEKIRPVILGGGTNVLAVDRPKTRVVISMKKMRGINVKKNGITASAGEPLQKIAHTAAKLGLSGMEDLAGIPGTIGGAVVMNAGGKYGCVGDVVETVATLDALGRRRKFRRPELRFSYRSGPFKKRIVTGVELLLRRSRKGTLENFKKILKEKSIRQPLGASSAGCIFLNPPDAAAGAVIEQAGLKGLAVGGASVSMRHANFIVTEKGARAEEVFRLIDIVAEKVYNSTGICLVPEVRVIR